MYADRLHRSRIDPVGITGATLVAGTMITGLIFAFPNAIPSLIDPGLTIYNIPKPRIAPPPPPAKPEIQPRSSTSSRPDPVVPDRLVITDLPPVNLGNVGPVTVDPPLNPGFGGGDIVAPPNPPAFVDAAADPRYADEFQPPYPASELRSGNEARISVRVLIGADGRVKQIEPVGADDAFFEATRRQALAHWRFKPATRGGVAVETWKTMSVRFQLVE